MAELLLANDPYVLTGEHPPASYRYAADSTDSPVTHEH